MFMTMSKDNKLLHGSLPRFFSLTPILKRSAKRGPKKLNRAVGEEGSEMSKLFMSLYRATKTVKPKP